MLEQLGELALDGMRQLIVAVGKRLTRRARGDGCGHLGGDAGDVVAGEAAGAGLLAFVHGLDARFIH
nr:MULTISPECIES: hypothetical protein [Mesorhizobium]